MITFEDAMKQFLQEFRNYEPFEGLIKSAEEIALKPDTDLIFLQARGLLIK
jgi:hypothetical protein